MLRRALLAFELLIVLGIAGAGCKQGLGARCEQNSDCSSGICSMNGPGLGGVCQSANQPPQTSDGGGGDAPVDATADDAGSGAGSDAGQEAGASIDAGDDTGGAPDDAGDGDAAEAGPGTDAGDDAASADSSSDT